MPDNYSTEELITLLREEADSSLCHDYPVTCDLLHWAADRLDALTTQSDDDPEVVRLRMIEQHPLCVVTGHVLTPTNAVLITATNAAPAIVHADGEAFTLELLRQLEVQGVQVHRP